MLVKWDPVGSLISRDTFFDDFFKTDFPVAKTTFAPKIDVRENEKEFVISAELPGLEKDEFKLTVENNVLTLSGEKKFEHEEKEGENYRIERNYGSFSRSFRLTQEVDSKKTKADYKNGVLSITLPKVEKVKPKEIQINVK